MEVLNMIKEDLTGNKYGMLIVIKEVERDKNGRRWLCECECGNKKIILGKNLFLKAILFFKMSVL